MNWTREAPTEPGFYWVIFGASVTMASFGRYPDGSGWSIGIIDSDEPFDFKDFAAWCGPVVPPEVPVEFMEAKR